ncbi:MAG: PQQ-binding-like beta-propeller repeat protein [Vicinamibacterales bacterium]
MSRKSVRGSLAAVVLLAGIATVGVGVYGQAGSTNLADGTMKGEWPYYTGDVKGTRFSPLEQINASNFNKLEVAWRFKTDNLGTRPEFKLEGTPLMVKGVVYATAGSRRAVVALDARSGEQLWVFNAIREGIRAGGAPRQLSGRGLSYWTDGKGDDRILYVTTGYRLVALHAKNGTPVATFGRDGIVDLKVGAVFGRGQPIDLESGEIGLHSTPTVINDMILVGSSFKEGMTVKTHNNTKGLARAFDVRTGKLIWTFNTIPKPGEFGGDSWENESWAQNGNTGVWAQMTVDADAGLVYLPVETPTSDFYGGHRPGDNLFAETLVAVDLKTGVRKWHFQLVHHPVWDHDISSAPLLVDITVDGKPIKAVAQPTKQGWLYMFDRLTGKPIWPMPETPVPQSDVPGEKTAKTQPIPSKPPAYARTYVKIPDDVIDFTPAMRAAGLEVLKRYRTDQSPFVPYILGDVNGKLGSINIGNTGGGTNWPGAGLDPETKVAYLPASNSGVTSGSLVEGPQGFSDIRYLAGVKGQEFREREGPGFGSAADAPKSTVPTTPPAASTPVPPLGVDGLSIVKPPYGVLSAIDLNKGELMFQVPHGETPDVVRNNPALKGMTIPKTGQNGAVGLVITRTLVIYGDPQVTSPPGRPRGAMLRAYDKKTGAQVGEVWMPAQQSGSPMTYMLDGKQYIIVAVSGGNYSGEYIAYALPDGAR